MSKIIVNNSETEWRGMNKTDFYLSSGLIKRNTISFFVWFILCIITPDAYANQTTTPKPLDVSMRELALLPAASIITDPTNTLLAKDVLNTKLTNTFTTNKQIVSFGFSNSTHWFRIPLVNPGPAAITRILTIEPTWLDQVEIRLLQNGTTIQIHKGGDTLGFNQRTIAYNKINYELNIPTGQSELLIRTQTVDPYHVGLTLNDQQSFHTRYNTEMLLLGLLYGAIIALLLYNLMLYISTREPVYASYINYLFFFLLMHATYNGYSYAALWPDYPTWGNWAHSIFIYLFIFSGLAFSINFLELNRNQKQTYRWALRFSITLALSFIVTAVIDGYSLQVKSAIFWVLVYAPFVLILGLLSLKSGNRAARFFLTAAAAGFIGSFITGLAVAGLIDYSYFTYHAVDVGMLIDAILLSFALADRLRLAKLQTEIAKTQLLDATNKHATELESIVTERTLELKKSNATKDKFFSIIAHDLRGPIGGLHALLNESVENFEDFTPEILHLARESTKNTNNFLEQLLFWARSQQGDIKLDPIPIDANEILAETQNLFRSQCRNKGIHLQINTNGQHWVYADQFMLRTVLRNLTNNAIKFSHRDGVIEFNIFQKEDYYIIQISDNGIGISRELQEGLFNIETKRQSTHGTDGEVGTGLGLILCAEFVSRNKGTIGVSSQPGVGSTFWFSLPAANKNMFF